MQHFGLPALVQAQTAGVAVCAQSSQTPAVLCSCLIQSRPVVCAPAQNTKFSPPRKVQDFQTVTLDQYRCVLLDDFAPVEITIFKSKQFCVWFDSESTISILCPGFELSSCQPTSFFAQNIILRAAGLTCEWQLKSRSLKSSGTLTGSCNDSSAGLVCSKLSKSRSILDYILIGPKIFFVTGPATRCTRATRICRRHIACTPG